MSKYLKAFKRQTEGLEHISVGVCSSCEDCQGVWGMDEGELHKGLESGEVNDEGGFSRRACEACGSYLAGDRYAAHARLKDDGRLVHLDVCADCLVFIANGDEPETWEG